MRFRYSLASKMVLTGAICVVALCAVGLQPADAHRPWFNAGGTPDPGHPYELRDLDISQVIYGGLTGERAADYYALTAPDDFALDLSLVVPDVESCARFRPVIVLLGSDLGRSDPLPPAVRLPGSMPGSEAIVAERQNWGTFLESFTGTTYATGPEIRSTLQAGPYLIVVTEPDGDTGSYGLTLGGSEVHGGDPEFLTRIDDYADC